MEIEYRYIPSHIEDQVALLQEMVDHIYQDFEALDNIIYQPDVEAFMEIREKATQKAKPYLDEIIRLTNKHRFVKSFSIPVIGI